MCPVALWKMGRWGEFDDRLGKNSTRPALERCSSVFISDVAGRAITIWNDAGFACLVSL